MCSEESDGILFSYDINGPPMHPLARFQSTDSPHDEATRDKRDPVVVQAIANVTSRQLMEDWWALSPGVRTHAIYDEIRRLDRAWSNKSAAPIEQENASSPHYQMA
jgi:hypothetical protein